MIRQQVVGGKYGSSNLGRRAVLGVLLPVLTLATARVAAAQQTTTSAPTPPNSVISPTPTQTTPAPATFPQALTGRERWHLYLSDTFLSPGPYVVSLGAGLAFQAFNYPPEWRSGFRGFGRRSANQFGIDTVQNSVHDGGEALLGYEPRYVPCRCRGGGRRVAHALEMTFLTYDQNGHKRFDFPQLAGAYGSGVLSTLWYPKRYTPQVQGIQTGHLQFGFVMGTNVFEEFRPELQRAWPFRKFLKGNAGKNP